MLERNKKKAFSQLFWLLLMLTFSLSNTGLGFAISYSDIDSVIGQTPYYDPGCSVSASSNGPDKIELKDIVQKYQLQSVLVKKYGGNAIGSYNATQPPNSPASVLKLIIADAFLDGNPVLDKEVPVTAAELYQGSDASLPSPVSLKYALNQMLTFSSDTYANVLIDAAGGLSAITDTAHKLGYKSTLIRSYYKASATEVLNSTNVTDLTNAMENIFTANNSVYTAGQSALSSKDRNTFGIVSTANKWGGVPGDTTHKPATGNSALVNVNNQKYIITMYVDRRYDDNASKSVQDIRDATNDIKTLIEKGSPVDTTGGQCCDTSSSLTGNSHAEQAFKYFLKQGLSPAAAAGLVGNFQGESGVLLNTHADNGLGFKGIAQWSQSRWDSLLDFADGRDPYALDTQLDYAWAELSGKVSSHNYKSSTLDPLKTITGTDQTAVNKATEIVTRNYEVPCIGDECLQPQFLPKRQGYAWKLFQQYGNSTAGGSAGNSAADCSEGGSANLKQTITVKTPGKFITMPSRYSCPGHVTRIDSRLAADIAYFVLHYNLCANDGLASGHNSHGAGVAVDMVPKNGNSKSDWANSAEAAARDIGWWGDRATDPVGTVHSCANYVPGPGDPSWGQCMHAVYPDKFPLWLRWLGYNGAYIHGDPWHIYGTGASGAHIHIGWDTPNHDGVSENEISQPRESVYVFPAPIPNDLKDLVK